MSMIKIEHLRKEYPNVTPLKDVCAVGAALLTTSFYLL